MKCPECERTEQRLREAIRVLGKIAGTAEAAKQRDPAAYLQDMARKAWLALDVKPAGPSMAPTERPRLPSSVTYLGQDAVGASDWFTREDGDKP